VIESILPSWVVGVETRGDLDVEIFPQEQVAIRAATSRRKREFLTARACAHGALSELGLPPSPIAMGSSGQPLWPPGVVGSITHCDGYRACALAHSERAAAVGIDAEPHTELPRGVLGAIARSEERIRLAETLRAAPHIHCDRLLFSAKEAAYKAWFTLTERTLDLEEIAVTIGVAKRLFHASLPVDGRAALLAGKRLSSLSGRWLIHDGLILTTVVLVRGPQSTGL
jgi:4'-phosphopantetheinyl transferase EntD